MRYGRFDWRRFYVAAAISVTVHVFWIIPKVIGNLVLKPPPGELEVTWMPDTDEPAVKDEAPVPEPTPEQKKKLEKEKQERQKLAAAPEPAKLEEKKKEAELELKPPPPQQPQPPPPPLIDHRKQMVD